MKSTTKTLLAMSLLLFWSTVSADGVIKNGAKLKLKKGTHLIVKNDLQIQNNASVIIEGMLSIDGELSNENSYQGIIITSDLDNTGSLIQEMGNAPATVNRFMRNRSTHFIGAPVTGELREVLDFGGDPFTQVYSFNEASSNYQIINDGNHELINGAGYRYYIGSSSSQGVTPSFQGELFAEDLELDHNSIPALQHQHRGFNLIANPYASAIDWDDESIEVSNMEHSVWVYDGRKRRFRYRNSSGYGSLTEGIIPMGQGFLIKTRTEEASITIPKQARRHAANEFYKSENAIDSEVSYLVFHVKQDTLEDEIWLGYQWDSSDDFDNGIDVSKLFHFEEVPQFYSVQNEDQLSINMIEEPLETAKIIPIHFLAGIAGTHELSLVEFQGFGDKDLLLEDLLTGIWYPIEDFSSVEFQSSPEDESLRFLLHINQTVNTNDLGSELSNVQIYSWDKQIYINSKGVLKNQTKQVKIFDINGRLLSQQNSAAEPETIIKNPFQNQILIIECIYTKQSFQQKIIKLK
ncbi:MULTISPECIES: hypothetical protein [unclassified Lentimicrobium]|uniref:hypothetical protein n=1 Tax=unclassified Lentimicrobium TaxID=2677434 RepID=UPI001551EC5B|nr:MULTISPECIES: hypothetical protein [unclassified Lentimicrobium]NPD46885.1 hypothetical protein [Lentimicrobium sp. S6]NPD83843.1 hypothetical protein [Lentimicrobium sp. L6]